MRSLSTLLIFIYLPIFLIGQNDQIPNFGEIGQFFNFAGIVPTTDRFIGVANGRSNGQFDNDIILYQIDINGEILGSSAIEKEGIQEVNTVTHFEDGFFIVGGMTDDQPTGEGEAYLMGFENDGTLAWELIYPGEKEDRILRAGKVSESEAVFLVGYQSGFLEAEKALIKVSKTGELLWEIEPDLMFPYDRILSINGDNEGNILITGINALKGFIRSYDTNGNINWEVNQLSTNEQIFDRVYDLWFDESQDRYLILMLSSPSISGANSLTVGHIDMDGNILNIATELGVVNSPGFFNPSPSAIIPSIGNENHFFVSYRSEIKEWRISPDLSEIEQIGIPLFFPEIGSKNTGFDMFYENQNLVYVSTDDDFGAYNVVNEELVFQKSLDISSQTFNESSLKHTINQAGQIVLFNNYKELQERDPNGNEVQELEPSAETYEIEAGDLTVLSDGKIAFSSYELEGSLKYDLFDTDGDLITSFSTDDVDYPYLWYNHVEPLSDGNFIAAYSNIPFLGTAPFHYFLHADKNGVLIEKFDLSDLNLLYFQKMLPVEDQNLLLIGVTEDESAFRLMKISLNGAIIWDKEFFVSGVDKVRGEDLSISADGKYAFSGSVLNDESGAIYWAELDTDGNISRSGLVDEQMSTQHRNSFIHYNALGEILLFSSAHNCIANPDSEAYYMGYWKVDENDEVTELAKYFSAYPLVANDSELLADGRLSISGFERYWNEQDFFAVILDENGLVGVEDQSLLSQLDFRLSPNPTTGPLKLSLNSQYQGPIRIAISDMNGQMIHLMNTEKLIEEWQYEWDVSHLPKGSYTVQIMTKEGGVAKLWIRK